jgi:xanthine dehydrogenase/oxidase
MIQVASHDLGIPAEKIHIVETNTQHVPNSSATAASTGSNLNGMAVLKACEQLNARLKPYKEKNPNATWEKWVSAAYLDRINLSANGFYRTPDIGFDWETGTGDMFTHFTQGACVSLVEIDCLTGDHTVLKSNIVMDIGKSINPRIDIGQIEGGFMQGYGLMTLEEQRYSPSGYLFTRGPGFYKIPGVADIPVEMNVTLMKKASDLKAVYSSKGIGEPPLFLAASVFFAIKEAVKAARLDAGLPLDSLFTFDSPATAERIRMACVDQFTQEEKPYENNKKPWFVHLDD